GVGAQSRFGQTPADGRPQTAVDVLDQFPQNVNFAGEVDVERALSDAGPPRNVGDLRLEEAHLGEAVLRRLQQLAPGALPFGEPGRAEVETVVHDYGRAVEPGRAADEIQGL